MKKILIAGASSGIGLALAEKLSTKHISVISLSRKRPDIQVDQHIPYDVTGEQELPPMEGPLHGLVYCPGTMLLKPFRHLKLQDFRNDLEVNVLGAIRVIRHYLPSLILTGKASIVLFSTVAARTGMPFHSSVATSKAAVEGLMVSLAAELAPSIRVNAIAPSLVSTPLTSRLIDTEGKISVAGEKHPLKRIGTESDIADTAIFLLSEQSSWITGQIIHVDGGLSTIKV